MSPPTLLRCKDGSGALFAISVSGGVSECPADVTPEPIPDKNGAAAQGSQWVRGSHTGSNYCRYGKQAIIIIVIIIMAGNDTGNEKRITREATSFDFPGSDCFCRSTASSSIYYGVCKREAGPAARARATIHALSF